MQLLQKTRAYLFNDIFITMNSVDICNNKYRLINRNGFHIILTFLSVITKLHGKYNVKCKVSMGFEFYEAFRES